MTKKKTTTKKKPSARKKAPAGASRKTSRGRKTEARRSSRRPASKRKGGRSNGSAGRSSGSSRRASRSAPVPTIKATGMTEQISERIRYVRGLKGESRRVEVLSSILMEILDRFHMKELSLAVIEELGKTNHPKAIEMLSFAWNNCQNAETRSGMVRALASFPHKEVLRPLERIALTTNVASELRIQAVEALGRHRTNASWTALGRVLRDAGESGDKPLQSAAIEALRRGNGRAVPSLLRALDSEDEDERISAATALGIMGDRAALDPLKEISGRAKSWPLREAATKSAILIYCS